jgi:hypothetical protein
LAGGLHGFPGKRFAQVQYPGTGLKRPPSENTSMLRDVARIDTVFPANPYGML